MRGTRARGMIGKDLRLVTIYMVLAIMLVGAMEFLYAGSYEPPAGAQGPEGPGGGTSPVPREVEVYSATDFTAEGSTTEIEFEFREPTTLSLFALLTWTDDLGNNDEMDLELSLEGEVVSTEGGTNSPLEVGISQQEGSSLAGNYTIRVAAVDCPGQVSQSPVDRDGGNSWDLEVTAMVMAGEGGEG